MDMSLFDLGAWRDCVRQAMGRRDFEDMAGDVAAADDPVLINHICARTLPRRGITAEPDQVLATLGTQNALWLAIQLMVRSGFHAVVENPGHPDISSALRWLGARVTAVDVDGDGLPPNALPDDTDAVFVTPSHHAPTAVTMPIHRRQQLLGAAEERDFVIVEDDYDFETSFLAAPSPSLKSLDRSDRVIYVGSFSKALFPGLRLGYMVAAAPFIREARWLRALMLRHPPGHLQRTTGYFLALGHYDQLIRTQRLAFAARREIATLALQREGLELRGAAAFGGTNLWVSGPDGLDSTALAEALRQDGVLIEPGASFYENPGPVRFFRLGYSAIAAGRIDEGIRRISRRLRELT
jgi:GntR family transcriptional regulator/MocR family aminotransferase